MHRRQAGADLHHKPWQAPVQLRACTVAFPVRGVLDYHGAAPAPTCFGTQMEMENRRAETRARIEASRLQARARVEEQEKHRRALADAMYRHRLSEDRLRVVDPVW